MATAAQKTVKKVTPNSKTIGKVKKMKEVKPLNVQVNNGDGDMIEVKLTAAEEAALAEPNPSGKEMDETEGNSEMTLDEEYVSAERKGFEDMPWYLDIPKKDRLRVRDVVYNKDLDRFGFFTGPARKPNLARMRLLKVASKDDIYTRSWFVPYDALMLVKRGDMIKRGFVETDREYVRRAGKINRKESE